MVFHTNVSGAQRLGWVQLAAPALAQRMLGRLCCPAQRQSDRPFPGGCRAPDLEPPPDTLACRAVPGLRPAQLHAQFQARPPQLGVRTQDVGVQGVQRMSSPG